MKELDPTTLLTLEISGVASLLAMITGYAVYSIKKPKHYLNVWTTDDGVIPVKIKKLGNHVDWVDPSDKSTIRFILDPRFARHTKNGGLRFYADVKTGLLQRFNSNVGTFEHLDPKYLMRALNDGRIQQIARAAKGGPIWEQYILPGLIILGLLSAATLFIVYQMFNRKGGGG